MLYLSLNDGKEGIPMLWHLQASTNPKANANPDGKLNALKLIILTVSMTTVVPGEMTTMMNICSRYRAYTNEKQPLDRINLHTQTHSGCTLPTIQM